MTTIMKDKKGNVLSAAADTTYHQDGTGPRDADGALIVEGDDRGLSTERVESAKRALGAATPSTPAAASPATAANTEA
jgi:hypothetical protein